VTTNSNICCEVIGKRNQHAAVPELKEKKRGPGNAIAASNMSAASIHKMKLSEEILQVKRSM